MTSLFAFNVIRNSAKIRNGSHMTIMVIAD